MEINSAAKQTFRKQIVDDESHVRIRRLLTENLPEILKKSAVFSILLMMEINFEGKKIFRKEIVDDESHVRILKISSRIRAKEFFKHCRINPRSSRLLQLKY